MEEGKEGNTVEGREEKKKKFESVLILFLREKLNNIFFKSCNNHLIYSYEVENNKM